MHRLRKFFTGTAYQEISQFRELDEEYYQMKLGYENNREVNPLKLQNSLKEKCKQEVQDLKTGRKTVSPSNRKQLELETNYSIYKSLKIQLVKSVFTISINQTKVMNHFHIFEFND